MFQCFIKLFPPLYENFSLVLCTFNNDSSFTEERIIENITPNQRYILSMSIFGLNQICKIRFTENCVCICICATWYHLYYSKIVKNTHGRVLLLVKLQAFRLFIHTYIFFILLSCFSCGKFGKTLVTCNV